VRHGMARKRSVDLVRNERIAKMLKISWWLLRSNAVLFEILLT